MKKINSDYFTTKKTLLKPLIIFEMANNHGGSVAHGEKIIEEIRAVCRGFDFHFAFKFQLRDIDSFIHPEYKNKSDHAYVQRFIQTALPFSKMQKLFQKAKKHGFTTVCTPFDERSVLSAQRHGADIIKIASCSATDWPLLEEVAKTDKPVIISVAGVKVADIDKVVSFFTHRGKQFALLHCVGEYPTPAHHAQINQIGFLKKRYPDIPVGFSTHESPKKESTGALAYAAGARIFEKHVAVEAPGFARNAYSATPPEIRQWLLSIESAIKACGVSGMRATFSKKELADLRQFKRGVFAKHAIKKGDRIEVQNTFYAFPAQSGQLVANDMSKYAYFFAASDIEKNAPVIHVTCFEQRETILKIVKKVPVMLAASRIPLPKKAQFDLEISHHYGPEKFFKFGATLVTCVNRQYCKKLIIMFPGQTHPVQYHKKKEETFHVLYGNFEMRLNGKKQMFGPGDIVTIEPGVRHGFTASKGGVLEEISSTHFTDDSYYDDEKIMNNKFRKTFVTYWVQ